MSNYAKACFHPGGRWPGAGHGPQRAAHQRVAVAAAGRGPAAAAAALVCDSGQHNRLDFKPPGLRQAIDFAGNGHVLVRGGGREGAAAAGAGAHGPPARLLRRPLGWERSITRSTAAPVPLVLPCWPNSAAAAARMAGANPYLGEEAEALAAERLPRRRAPPRTPAQGPVRLSWIETPSSIKSIDSSDSGDLRAAKRRRISPLPTRRCPRARPRSRARCWPSGTARRRTAPSGHRRLLRLLLHS